MRGAVVFGCCRDCLLVQLQTEQLYISVFLVYLLLQESHSRLHSYVLVLHHVHLELESAPFHLKVFFFKVVYFRGKVVGTLHSA